MYATQWFIPMVTTILIVHVSGESCKAGFYPDARGNCKLCTTNCVECRGATTCLTCNSGYFESSGTCIASTQIENRTGCDNNGCKQCVDGFILHSGTCAPCYDPNCSKCSGVGDASCTSCKHGYFINNNGKCIQCNIAYCRECINEDKCMRCSAGYYLDSDACHRCKDTYCKVCTSPGGDVCTTCSDRYFAEAHGQCTKCNATCLRCSSKTECSICADGFYLNNGVCIACDSYCKRCNSAGHCEECLPGYWGQTCNKTCSVNCEGEMCAMTTGQCYRCQPSYYGDKCDVNCSDTCRNGTCEMSGVCNGCIPGFYDDYCDKKCIDDNCVNSECFQRNGVCIDHCPNGCSSCKSKTTCDICQSGLYGSSCQYDCSVCKNKGCRRDKCTWGCKNGFYSDDNIVCKQCPSNCKSCTSTDTCTGCVSGKYGDTCQLDCDTTICLSCDETPTNCTACKPGYVIVGNTCCQGNCSTCDVQDHGLCLTCPDGFHGATCGERCEGFCKSCNTSGICTACGVSRFNSKSTLEVGLCKCDDNECNIRDDSTSACNACKSPGWYTHIAGCCPCSKNCKHAGQCTNITGECTDGCKPGWWGPQCDQRCHKPCLECTSGTCTRCKPGYHGDRCQHTCSRNCSKISNRSVCDLETGHCSHECTNGTWGPECENPCDPGCLNVGCNRTSGACPVCNGSFCDTDSMVEEDGTSFVIPIVLVVSIVLFIVVILVIILIRRKSKRNANIQRRKNDEDANVDFKGDATGEGLALRELVTSDQEEITENAMYVAFQPSNPGDATGEGLALRELVTSDQEEITENAMYVAFQPSNPGGDPVYAVSAKAKPKPQLK